MSDLSRINLTDNKDAIISKIKKQNRSLPLPADIKELDKRAEAKNLLSIYSSLQDVTLEKSVNEFSGKNFSEFKEILIQVLVDKIEPISNEINKLMADKKYLDNILHAGSKKANKLASEKIRKIKEIVGFY